MYIYRILIKTSDHPKKKLYLATLAWYLIKLAINQLLIFLLLINNEKVNIFEYYRLISKLEL